jgi:hypothetical protein
MDSEVRRIVGTDVSDSSFEYHVVKLMLLIGDEVQDEVAYKEMTNEMILALNDLRTWFSRK